MIILWTSRILLKEEAHEMFMITDATLCHTCYHDAPLGHTRCTCGHTNPGASDEVKEQVLNNVMSCLKTPTTFAFVLKQGTPEEKLVAAKSHHRDHRVRDHLKSVKKMDKTNHVRSMSGR